jgi:hypothetical protein
MEKTLALIIRSHGGIQISYEPGKHTQEIVNLVPLRQFNIGNLHIVSLAKLGGVCFGDSKIGEFVREVSKYYKLKNPNASTEDRINQVFLNPLYRTQFSTIIRDKIHSIFAHSFEPEIFKIEDEFLEKIYTPYDDNSGIFVFSHSSTMMNEMPKINEILQELTQKLNTVGLYRGEIFNSLNEFNITNLYLIDLTCNGYIQNPYLTGVPPFTEEHVNWLNANLTHVRGGKSKMRKTRRKHTKM